MFCTTRASITIGGSRTERLTMSLPPPTRIGRDEFDAIVERMLIAAHAARG